MPESKEVLKEKENKKAYMGGVFQRDSGANWKNSQGLEQFDQQNK